MRGSDFQNLPITFVLGWPVTVLAGAGLALIVGLLVFGGWWVISHLQWVP
jgi:hypothetical protein